MARIAGVDLPRGKRIEVALTYIYGIGDARARKILASTGVDRTMVDAVAALLVLALLVPPAVLMARSRRGGS